MHVLTVVFESKKKHLAVTLTEIADLPSPAERRAALTVYRLLYPLVRKVAADFNERFTALPTRPSELQASIGHPSATRRGDRPGD